MAQKKNRRWYELWLSFSIKQKLYTFAGVMIVTVGLAIVSNMVTINYALYGFGTIMSDNVKSSAFLDAVSLEAQAFETYVRLRTDENKVIFEEACEKTDQCVWSLPYDYQQIGATRYARTWSILNCYTNYVEERDRFLMMDPEDESYVSDLYQIYRLQEFLDLYARRLMQLTTQDGNDDYLRKEAMLYRIPYLLLSGAVVLVGLIIFLTFLLWNSLVTPLEQLVHESRKIARNEYPKDDLEIDSHDEMGELVVAFNKMKHATVGYIGALEEKYKITQLLHKEELDRVETEKNLEEARLEVLKSQINPHFLFNTLNMIACMAKLEDAEVTERMIGSLSNLFRYNLKTTEAEVPLWQEIKVVDDYMYLQQMRFGNRVQYEKDLEFESNDVLIPSFSLQPLVENAIIHGVSKKEQGGKLLIRTEIKEGMLLISIIDSGIGMEREALLTLTAAMGRNNTAKIGIGLGNINKRLYMMYAGAGLQIRSKENMGTRIQMEIPLSRKSDRKETGEKDVSFIDS